MPDPKLWSCPVKEQDKRVAVDLRQTPEAYLREIIKGDDRLDLIRATGQAAHYYDNMRVITGAAHTTSWTDFRGWFNTGLRRLWGTGNSNNLVKPNWWLVCKSPEPRESLRATLAKLEGSKLYSWSPTQDRKSYV